MGRGFAALLLASLLPLAGGCQRKTQFVPPDADSTRARGVDSASVRVRVAQDRWEGGPSAESASAIAEVVADRLRHEPPAEWKSAADALLDSLGVGAETATADCILAINLFSRSDPGMGSWPFLAWCGAHGAMIQGIEGKGLHLDQIVSRGDPHAAGTERAVAALFGSHGGGGQQPLLMVWRLDKERFGLIQTLGPDSLGGVGTGEFTTAADGSTDLVTRTYRTPRYFDECATCPHLYRTHRFHWGAPDFDRVEDVAIASPYSTFVAFIQALMGGDHDAASRLVTNGSLVDQARRFAWDSPKGAWRIAPTMDESPSRLVFFRGEKEAFAVQFAQQGSSWLIAAFDAVPREVE
jgi:hypothetical protein